MTISGSKSTARRERTRRRARLKKIGKIAILGTCLTTLLAVGGALWLS